ncbi:MAG: hypothetical protein ABI321_00675 [Polyangia bacterium]
MRYLALFALLAGCIAHKPHKAVWTDDQVEIERMAALLPATLPGGWTSSGAPKLSIERARLVTERKTQASRLMAERIYHGPDGKVATIDVVGGELSVEHAFLDPDVEHPFRADSPEAWRTTSTRGFRTRIGEPHTTPMTSEAYVLVGTEHTVDISVTSAAVGESAQLAAAIALEKL